MYDFSFYKVHLKLHLMSSDTTSPHYPSLANTPSSISSFPVVRRLHINLLEEKLLATKAALIQLKQIDPPSHRGRGHWPEDLKEEIQISRPFLKILL